jgi:glycosyltransferase involved in cell wall biosynthesis
MLKTAPISVLISTYGGESDFRLKRALDSIRDQTLAPSEIVLVVDGPVGACQEQVIVSFSSNDSFGQRLKVVRLERNAGLANALNVGLKHCGYSWVARLDSDDVAYPERFEIQWKYLQQHPNVDLLASWHRDCGEDGTPLGRIKKIPEEHDEILKHLKWRNIITHSTIIYRRDQVLRLGGYSTTLSLQEDYDLFARLAVNGARFAACQMCLVDFASTLGQRKRRGGLQYLTKSEWPARRAMLSYGFISFPFAAVSIILRTAFVLCPSNIKWFLYGFVRSKDDAVTESV